jgi:hypothetical protein
MATADLTQKRGQDIPTNLIDKLSGYTRADHCFVDQRFSEQLQCFMVNYVYNINSYFNQNG